MTMTDKRRENTLILLDQEKNERNKITNKIRSEDCSVVHAEVCLLIGRLLIPQSPLAS